MKVVPQDEFTLGREGEGEERGATEEGSVPRALYVWVWFTETALKVSRGKSSKNSASSAFRNTYILVTGV